MGTKWADATAAEKILALYSRLLFSDKEASLTELSWELRCSKQTVSRLVNQLEASRFGKIVRSSKGREALYGLARPRNLPKISVNAEGLHQLAMCRDFILHLLPDAMRKNVDAVLQQASAFLPENDALPESIVQSFTKGRINYTPFQDILNTMAQAVHSRKVCMVSYKSALHEKARAYEYAPKRLIAFREALYFTGWVVSEKGTARTIHDTPTTLAVHRIQKAALTRRTTEHLPEPEEEHEGAFGLSWRASRLQPGSVLTSPPPMWRNASGAKGRRSLSTRTAA